MFKLGLKLWSTNKNYYEEAIKLYGEGIYDYIELFAVPGSYKENISMWKNAKDKYGISFVIHAPHYSSGMNLAVKDKEENNKVLAGEAFNFADDLSSDTVIFHSGVGGSEDETARQLRAIHDKRIVIENTPYLTIDGRQVCNGHSPEQIEMIAEKSKVGFCLDFGHAICAANSKRVQPYDYINDFLSLNPKMFHLTDGDLKSEKDQHRHFGNGDFDISKMISLMPAGARITVETVKDETDNLNDFVRDMKFLKNETKNAN